MKVVLDTKPESAYDDDIASRYHFPPRYLALLREAIGDWAVFRRPRAGGDGIAYFAVGRVAGIEADPATPGYHYARIEEFLPFDEPVPWRLGGRYAEAALRSIENIPQVGLYLRGKSVRPLEEDDFDWIVGAGLSESLGPTGGASGVISRGAEPEQTDPGPSWDSAAIERRIVAALVNRKVRDASFRRAVCEAYQHRCALTGIRVFDAEGRAEVQAAHILPVAQNGPDIVQNGIALCATAHWLFDRHLISVSADFRLLISERRIPIDLRQWFVPLDGSVLLPRDRRLWPSATFLDKHRAQFQARHQDAT